ncbi:MAG: CRTAC1 family protein [Acidobacteria bacterium]|nr:MAG: CRTAC1 family protein [Acidobacteriota bacterium]
MTRRFKPTARTTRRTLLAAFLLAGAASAPGGPARGEEGAIFVDRTAAAGVDFVHLTGATGERYFPEIMGAGAGLVDYDGDGDLDLYLVQGGSLAGADEAPPSDRLYRNDLTLRADGSRQLRFTDVTAESGIRATGYGMGVATGDYDRDGHPDLYLTNYGPNQLWRNRGDGTFEDVTAATGSDDHRWSVPAVFFDYDGDRWLDLFVGNYAAFRPAIHKRCVSPAGLADYCSPASYEPEGDRLLHNDGGRRFTEATLSAGLGGARGYALGAIPADFDGDGRLDLYVANDGVPNNLWHNLGPDAGGRVRFEDLALLAGCAVNERGEPEASMGVDAGDYDADGDLDLFMTHLKKETNTLYAGDGQGGFDDRSRASGLGLASWQATGFGVAWIDYDNDGWLDLLAVNGAVTTIEELVQRGDPHPFHQPNQLFRNLGPDATGQVRFEDVTERAGTAFATSLVSRGAAFGDLDQDGDVDVVVTNNGGPAQILINAAGQDRPWLGLRLVDGASDVPGAWVGVKRRDAATLWRLVRMAGSYASANDPRLTVGLGDRPQVTAIVVHWPDGLRETFPPTPLRTYATLKRGTGKPLEAPP